MMILRQILRNLYSHHQKQLVFPIIYMYILFICCYSLNITTTILCNYQKSVVH